MLAYEFFYNDSKFAIHAVQSLPLSIKFGGNLRFFLYTMMGVMNKLIYNIIIIGSE